MSRRTAATAAALAAAALITGACEAPGGRPVVVVAEDHAGPIAMPAGARLDLVMLRRTLTAPEGVMPAGTPQARCDHAGGRLVWVVAGGVTLLVCRGVDA